MNLSVIMQKNKKYDVYTFKGSNDWRFFPVLKILSEDFSPGELIDWLSNDNKPSRSNESISIRKERGVIALYDINEQMLEGAYASINQMLDPTKRFEMTLKNFAKIVYQWEELRVSRPDIILVVIHEDNHVSLETDPAIIKEYQDAGYAFDINK